MEDADRAGVSTEGHGCLVMCDENDLSATAAAADAPAILLLHICCAALSPSVHIHPHATLICWHVGRALPATILLLVITFAPESPVTCPPPVPEIS